MNMLELFGLIIELYVVSVSNILVDTLEVRRIQIFNVVKLLLKSSHPPLYAALFLRHDADGGVDFLDNLALRVTRTVATNRIYSSKEIAVYTFAVFFSNIQRHIEVISIFVAHDSLVCFPRPSPRPPFTSDFPSTTAISAKIDFCAARE